jgi:hypothetical protein
MLMRLRDASGTTVRSGRAAATPMANEMPLPIAPNSMDGASVLIGVLLPLLRA